MNKVLVTGATKGLGKAIATLLSEKGFDVTGTYQKEEDQKQKVKFRMIKLELRDPESIVDCAKEAGEIDILINNAAISQLGPAEETPSEKWKEIFQVNFFGTIELTNKFIPGMRAKGAGRIVNIGSLADRLPVPFQSSYSATKFALRSYTLCIWNELRPFGIKVSLAELFNVRTEDLLNRPVNTRENSHYKERFNKYIESRKKGANNADPPELVAKSIHDIISVKDPRPVYIPGNRGKLISLLPRFLSEKALLNIIAKRVGN